MPVDLSQTAGSQQRRETWQFTSAALVRRYQRAFARAAKVLPINRVDSVDRQRDRFLPELATRADILHRQLLRAMRDHATSGDPRKLRGLCEVAIELQDIRSDHRQAVNAEVQQRVADHLAQAARGILSGLGREIALLESDQPALNAPWHSRSEVVSDLTRREYEVLQLMAKGATNREIATTIFRSEETVKTHVKRILQKFGVANRGQAVAMYLESLDRRAGLSGDPRRAGVSYVS
jgi:DNA-binding CsgD family transcriptional regulator